ncbi:10269_t:CDS:2, partial [Cetraspora pellucida]
MNDIEQLNVFSSICLSNTEPGPNKNFDSDDFFTRQPKKRKNLSITTEQKKKKKVFSKSIICIENLSNESTTRHDNDYITNEHNNHITNNDIANKHNCDYITGNMPESSSNTNQTPKPNLKDLQLVPIDKVPRKRWNHMGYFGVTCSFIDNDFQLNEIVLMIQYLLYPYTGKAIVEALHFIINDWKLTNKELLDAEILIACAKRLMLFFTMPKQTERLIDIQKNLHRSENI